MIFQHWIITKQNKIKSEMLMITNNNKQQTMQPILIIVLICLAISQPNDFSKLPPGIQEFYNAQKPTTTKTNALVTGTDQPNPDGGDNGPPIDQPNGGDKGNNGGNTKLQVVDCPCQDAIDNFNTVINNVITRVVVLEKMQGKIEGLTSSLYNLQDSVGKMSQSLANLQGKVASLASRRPKVTRISPQYLSSEISLHQTTASIEMTVPIPSGLDVFGLLVEVYYHHSSRNDNNVGSHGYMSARMNQKDDGETQAVYTSRKFNWYANTAVESEIIPWNNALPNVLQAYIYDTYNTEAPGNPYGKNYYRIRLAGYLSY